MAGSFFVLFLLGGWRLFSGCYTSVIYFYIECLERLFGKMDGDKEYCCVLAYVD